VNLSALQTTGPLLVVAFEAALVILQLLAFAGVPHEVERAGGVDLHAGLDGDKKLWAAEWLISLA
jgi:hypothetical protein